MLQRLPAPACQFYPKVYRNRICHGQTRTIKAQPWKPKLASSTLTFTTNGASEVQNMAEATDLLLYTGVPTDSWTPEARGGWAVSRTCPTPFHTLRCQHATSYCGHQTYSTTLSGTSSCSDPPHAAGSPHAANPPHAVDPPEHYWFSSAVAPCLAAP